MRAKLTPTIVKLFPLFAVGKICLTEAVSLLQKIASVHSSPLAAKADTLVDPFAHKRVLVGHAGRVRQENRIGVYRATERLDGPGARDGLNGSVRSFPGGLRKPAAAEEWLLLPGF